MNKPYVPNFVSILLFHSIYAKFYNKSSIILFQIWDTAGQERFKAMAPMFYRNANAALLVFDLTSQTSFESIKMWVQELKGNVDEPMMLCMVGNKIDLNDQREVRYMKMLD